MRCEFCQASGLSISSSVVVPCVECGGFGTLHPCEGLRAQPFDETSQVIMDLFKKLHKDGQTIVMITHEDEYAHMAGRILQLDDGKVVKNKVN
jgi:hypothetical protein